MTAPADPVPRVVLVAGGSGHLGAAVALRLAAREGVTRVIAVDTEPPRSRTFPRAPRGTVGVEFVRADIRNPLIAKVIASAEVDTVVHAGLVGTSRAGRTATKEMNVLGSMQLMAACQGAPFLRRLVLASTTAVYGCGPRDPAVFTEQTEARSLARDGYAKDASEAEGYVRGLARRRPDVAVTVLRLADQVGPGSDTTLTRYVALPVVPTVLGHDARLQVLHSQDAAAVTELACTSAVTGTFNVAGAGVLMLSQAIRRAGRLALPVPGSLTGPVARLVRGARLADFTPEQLAFLNFGRVVDTTAATSELGFTARWTTMQAFDDHVTAAGLRPVVDLGRVRGLEQAAVAVAGRWP